MVRHSIATLTPVYNTDRMVQEYTKDYYLTK
jgi:glucan phosphorylase